MDKILIPKEKLSDGFERSKNHVEFLLESSKILYDKNKHSLSIPLSVLAIEEYYKLRFILNHLENDVGITKHEWESITLGRGVHKSKLKKVYSEPKKQVIEQGEESYNTVTYLMAKMGDHSIWKNYPQAVEVNPYVEERLEKLDTIKQDCFYLGWKNSEWHNFIKIPPKQREALAYILLYVVRIMFNLVVLDYRHPEIHIEETAEDFKAYKNDPLFKENIELEKIKKTKEFKIKEMLAIKTIDAYQTSKLTS